MASKKPTNINEALAAAQGESKTLGMDGTGGKDGSTWKYVSATATIEALKPILVKYGLVAVLTETHVLEVMGGTLSVRGELRWGSDDSVVMPLRFDMPIAPPNRGKAITHSTQASHTSAVARLLRNILLVSASDDVEVDTDETPKTSAKPAEAVTTPRKTKKAKKSKEKPTENAPGDLAAFRTMAEQVGVEVDVLAMWATRKPGDNGKKHAVIGTLDSMVEGGMLAAGIQQIGEDIASAEAKNVSFPRFKKMIEAWADEQIPY